ncbi:DJ-1/PfpI family protein [Congregibacter litoralis]|uniref:Transcriptional regulator n=1 Tax=Congregibacter litoralis KT71 TaxID=314285 RepID=A4A7I7_9GAMM|nr:DJ-1/PfpI family protein [Congregibacter litoralis]EAQ98256.1 Transcriptional regulator [Congregibacter litoralis KT71]
MNAKPLQLGAVLYPGFEMLDYFGPLELFSVLGSSLITIHTVAENTGAVAAAIGSEGAVGPKVVADYSFADAPAFDVLLIPGGSGTLTELENPAMLEFLRLQSERAQWVSSVCTGSALLAKAGLLDGHRATSNKQVFAIASMQSDKVDWVEAARWVEDGKFFTSSGVSAGMDMSLAIIQKLFGEEAAETAASYTEYTWHRDADHDPFANELNVMAKQLGII